jgi:hypothetical protein
MQPFHHFLAKINTIMALPVVYGGYYYNVAANGMVAVMGPGIAPSGLQLSYVDTLDPSTFQAALAGANITPAAADALTAQSIEVGVIQTQLTNSLQLPDPIAYPTATLQLPEVDWSAVPSTNLPTAATRIPPAISSNITTSLPDPMTAIGDAPISSDITSSLPDPMDAIGDVPISSDTIADAYSDPSFSQDTPTNQLIADAYSDPSFSQDTPTNQLIADAYSDPSFSQDTPTNQLIADAYGDQSWGQDTPTNEIISTAFSDPSYSAQGLTTQLGLTSLSAGVNQNQLPDWRARLSLAPSATYLYKSSSPGILAPLAATHGVIFPYTPAIQVSYAAHYETATLTHSNYKIFQYGSSSVDNINITCDFTAQDTAEATYLLAVIHFFRSVTKMFYGQDQMPKPGTPPPLCYLTGFGAFQFDQHPLAIVSFNYTLPTEVDYIRASAAGTTSSIPKSAIPMTSLQLDRLLSSGLQPGGSSPSPNWATYPKDAAPTYVPTRMQIQLGAIPIVTRNDISNSFSLREYATGAMLQGSKRANRGGVW